MTNPQFFWIRKWIWMVFASSRSPVLPFSILIFETINFYGKKNFLHWLILACYCRSLCWEIARNSEKYLLESIARTLEMGSQLFGPALCITGCYWISQCPSSPWISSSPWGEFFGALLDILHANNGRKTYIKVGVRHSVCFWKCLARTGTQRLQCWKNFWLFIISGKTFKLNLVFHCTRSFHLVSFAVYQRAPFSLSVISNPIGNTSRQNGTSKFCAHIIQACHPLACNYRSQKSELWSERQYLIY